MSFMKPSAKVGTFGLDGLALSKGKKKTQTSPTPSLTTSDVTQGSAPTSMINSKSLY